MHTIPSVTSATEIARHFLFFIIIEAVCGVVNFAPNEKKVERIEALMSREGKFCNFRQFWDDNPYFSQCYTVH
jgi:hypothetical protein